MPEWVTAANDSPSSFWCVLCVCLSEWEIVLIILLEIRSKITNFEF